ncbi:MAG: class I SAM-dependent methyltransferase [Magnetococcales bacterium]|nr:class I SAM-dependent methyltransferase [Magnetococcales bacterium]MBF0155633.1 class I SAM-dependent methyltransferase [Magnetococcales bacterium]
MSLESFSTAGLPADLVESLPCPVCDAPGPGRTLVPACYPPGLTRDALKALYSASSDRTLLDRLAQCEGCGLVYLDPRVRREVILEAYTEAEDPTFIAQNPMRIRTFGRSLRVLSRRFPELGPGRRVLDVGCAGGAFPKAAADFGHRVTGIEPSRWLVAAARAAYGLDIRQGSLEDQDFGGERFELITLWDVLEHLTDPRATLTRLRDLLREGGLLVVTFPDHGSLARRLLGRRWPFFLSVHLYYFTLATLRRMLDRLGFATLWSGPYWQTLETGYVLRRAAHEFPPFGWAERGVASLGLSRVPLTYTIGQSLLVARKTS